jgi:CRISPR-associated protein, TIGR02710 family
MTASDERIPFPDIFASFRATVGGYAFRGLVLVGTLQADTPALLIAGLNPERVAFLLTDQSRPKLDEVRQRLAQVADQAPLRCSPDDWFCPDGDYSSVLRVYTGLRTVLDRWRDLERHEIAVDLTGGKSTMTVGLAKAAHVLRLTAVYVDSDYADGRPVPGTQRLATPEDPYTVFGDLEAAEHVVYITTMITPALRRSSAIWRSGCRIIPIMRSMLISRQRISHGTGLCPIERARRSTACWRALIYPPICDRCGVCCRRSARRWRS